MRMSSNADMVLLNLGIIALIGVVIHMTHDASYLWSLIVVVYIVIRMHEHEPVTCPHCKKAYNEKPEKGKKPVPEAPSA